MLRFTVRARRFILSLLLLLVASLASAEQRVLLLGDSGVDWREARRVIEQHGGQVGHVLLPNVLVGEIPDGVEAALQERVAAGDVAPGATPSSLRLVRTPDEARLLLGLAGTPGLAADALPASELTPEVVAALRLLAPAPVPVVQDPRYRVLPGGAVEVLPADAWEEPPVVGPKLLGEAALDLLPPTGQASGNTFFNTSDFLAGDVAVAIVRPESTGAIDPSTEDWTGAEVSNSLTQILGALDKLRNDAPRGQLTFVYRTESFGPGAAGTVSCDYEAILYANFDESATLNVLGKLGYTQTPAYNRMTEWVNRVRSDLGTDWAFGVFVFDNSTNTSRGRASAYITGPAGWLFQQYSASIYHHEFGHLWGALDEYHPDAAQSPTTTFGGYTQEVNANSQYNDGSGYFAGAGEGVAALMISNGDYVSPWTRGMWGTWDLDGDGIPETQDTVPTLTLNAPTGTSTLAFSGVATATPLRRETWAYASGDITVNRIVRVEWRANGSPWQDAAASDGSFGSSSEGFTFTTPPLKNGPYVFEARATDNFGNTTRLFPRREVTVSGSAVANNAPLAALVVTPGVGTTATVFRLDATGSLDAEDSTNLVYRWDFELDGTWDTTFSSSPVATHTYPVAGTQTARVEVRDKSGASTTRSVSVTVSAAPVAPTAAFAVDKGSLFASAPAVFSFDASGVSDGQDLPSALQVRWDFEDDGIWDTGFSTTKTASHDYAQGYATSAVFEAGNTYYYSGNTVNGFAESFVAGTTGIGRAELFLMHWNDNTSGGTVTVGIRSSLTGAFLTSVVRNQADLSEGDWNRFDFPDISVTSGGTYYLVMIASDADMMWLGDSAAGYAAGAPAYSFNGGVSWTTSTAYDHRFRVYDSSLSTVPLTKSKAWRIRMEVRNTGGLTSQTVRDVWTNAYDSPPTVSLVASTSSTTPGSAVTLTATAADPDSGTTWDGLLHYRFDTDGDGNFDTEFATGNTASVTFSQQGTYRPVVEVRDRYHAAARATVTITVAQAGGAAQLTKQAGDGQSALINVPLPVAPAVLVRDGAGSPLAGVAVVFAVASGGGAITAAAQTTNALGVATVGSWTLGPTAGANTLVASVPANPGLQAVTFSATGLVVVPASMVAQAGNGQTATVNAVVPTSPAVVVRDAANAPAPGVPVVFAVASGGGSLTGATQTTNALGIATVGGWRLGTSAGSNTLTATTSTLPGTVVTFTATATPASPASLAVQAGDGQSALVSTNVTVPPSVVVRDVFNNAVPGVTVAFAVGSGGGSLTGATQTTNAQGVATVGSWKLGAVAGLNRLTATSGSLPGTVVTFAATATPGPPASLAIQAGNGQSTRVGAAVPVAPAVLVRDASGNPVSGITVLFAVASGGGSATGSSQPSNSQGIATAGSWRLGPTPGANTLTATTAVLPGATVTFTATATAVPPQSVWHPFFAVDKLETPMVGDFNGDGKTDIITFTRQNPLAVGDVYVALSTGARFVDKNGNAGSSDKWHDWFAITTDETVVIGDYDGDGKDDIATWLGNASRQVYVALSTGTGMTHENVWANSIGFDPSDVILAGDVNGDGKQDLVCFARKRGTVYVALSSGSGFQAPVVWHGFFAVSTYERPRVADVNGDGKADIVTFATDSPTAFGDVYVALSNGTRFVDQNGAANSSTKWHDWFAIRPTEQVRIGDLDGDGKDDFFTFLPPPFGQCYTVQSLGTSMGENVLWRETVAPSSTDIPFVGDADGDGKADVIVFAQGEGKAYVSLAP